MLQNYYLAVALYKARKNANSSLVCERGERESRVKSPIIHDPLLSCC